MENKWKNKWTLMLLVGILLVVIAMPTGSKMNEEDKYALDEEMRLKNILEEMEGVGEAKVMLTYSGGREVEGVVIIVEGADHGVVVQNITNVVQALFDVETHKIKVMKGNQTN